MRMSGLKVVIFVFIFSVSVGVKWVGGQVHHVVGDDRGWDPSSDLRSWSANRVFRVGDKIWFTYSAAQDSVVELKSMKEYSSCNIDNPIRMYTDGLNSISLDREGIRYFASGNLESCNSGLKLHVDVQPQPQEKKEKLTVGSSSKSSDLARAAAPTTPSASTHLSGFSFMLVVGISLCLLGL